MKVLDSITFKSKTMNDELEKFEIQNSTQLPSRRTKTQAVNISYINLKDLTEVSAILDFLLSHKDDDDKLEIPLNNIPNTIFKFSFEDFRSSGSFSEQGNISWRTVALTSRVPTRKLLLSLVKKLVVNGININELLLLESILQKNWVKLTELQKVIAILFIKCAFATVNGAKTTLSCGKPLYKALKNPNLLKINPKWVVLFFTIYDSLETNDIEKKIKLTFIDFPTKAKKFPAKRHIGMSNSQIGSKSSGSEVLDEEIRLETKSPFDSDKVEHLMFALSRQIQQRL